jgi:uncharacterized low-complexity protein
MSPFLKLAAGFATSFMLGAMAATLSSSFEAEAKEYNKSKTVPSDSQALVNRIQAQMSGNNGEGEYGSRESDCGELNVGSDNTSNQAGRAPDDQVIIADKIINIDGNCRMIRNQGGFKPTEPQTTAKTPAKKP